MKRFLFCISLLIYIQANLFGQNTPDLNITYGVPSIRSITPLSPTAYSESAQGTTFKSDSIMDAIQYLDGLGRPIQIIQRGATPSHKDLVTYQEYDEFGRESKSWLPSVSSNKGAFIPLDIIEQNASTSYKDGAAYGTPLYEASPLNRLTEQYGPGKRWYDNKKSVRTEYLTNKGTSGELSCMLFTVDGEGLNTSLTKKGYYGNGELYVTKIIDEEEGISYEFKDKLGRVLLTRQMNLNNEQKVEQLNTYYVYDNSGDLCFVIPPIISVKAAGGNLSSTDIDLYGYQYKYDKRKRCIQKQLPGSKYVRFVYDKADRLIFTQDGEQRRDGKNEWLFSFTDAFGRNVLTGICKNTDITNEKYEKLLVEAEPKDDGTYRGYNLLVNGQSTVLKNVSVLTVNYYDDYGFLGKYTIPNWQFSSKIGYGIRYTADNTGYETKGLLTGTSVALLDGSGKFLHNVSYYDNRGRVVQTIASNHLEGEDKTWFAYSYTDQVTSQLHEHTAKGKDKQTELYTFSYDRAGRSTRTEHSLNGATPVVLADNKYNELGQLESTTANKQDKLTTGYAYNIRSWTTHITTGKLFKEVLDYTYSGNISNMLWKQDTDIKDRSYTFEYDKLSQLTNAKYTGIANEDYSSAYSYDLHGSMKTLTRMGMINNKPELIDDLSFDYIGNQMKNVKDQVLTEKTITLSDFKNYANQDIEYLFNDNGAMTQDLNKGITDIAYNSLNLPEVVTINHINAQAKNYYTYTASGAKLRVKHKNIPLLRGIPVSGIQTLDEEMTDGSTTDYVGNIIYEDGILDKIVLSNGYIQDGNYYFYVRDHLGNNRLVTDAAASVLQSTHYYPFGMSFAESTNQEKQPYKYNNKELDTNYELNWYDYEARHRGTEIPSFTAVDPHAENYYNVSPYVYVGNNPMRLIDPDGKDWRDFLNGVASGFTQKFENIAQSISHPVETYNNAKVNYQNQSVGEQVASSIIGAVDGATGGSASLAINTVQAVASDLNGGDGSATGKVIGGVGADATIAVGTGLAFQAVGKGVAALSKVTKGGGLSNQTLNPESLIRTERGISWKTSTEKVADIMSTAKTQGIKTPVDVFQSGGKSYIINGHHRVEAATRLGQNVPVNYLSSPTGYSGVGELQQAAYNASQGGFKVDARYLNSLFKK